MRMARIIGVAFLVLLCLAAVVQSAYFERHEVTVTVGAGASTATAYSPVLNGLIWSVEYVEDGTTPFGDTTGVVITTERSAQQILSVDSLSSRGTHPCWHPRAGIVTAGFDSIAADQKWGGVPFVVARERLMFTVGSATEETAGTFYVTVGG